MEIESREPMKDEGSGITICVGTPSALALLRSAEGDLLPKLLERHQSGDWGDVPPEDARENEFSVRYGFRVLSSYRVAEDKLWIITECDRSTTTLLLPSDSL